MAGTVLDGMCRIADAAGVGAYDPENPLPAGETPITVGDPVPDGDLCITLNTYPGGPEPDSRNGWDYPRLQVRTRGLDPLAALDLDESVFQAFQTASGPLGGVFTLVDCYALQSEAQPLGMDANGRHEFTRNYQLTIARTG